MIATPTVTRLPVRDHQSKSASDQVAGSRLARRGRCQPAAEPDDLRDGGALAAVRDAVLARADAEQALGDAVVRARHEGHSWAAIGAMVGTSGEAARERYSQAVPAE